MSVGSRTLAMLHVKKMAATHIPGNILPASTSNMVELHSPNIQNLAVVNTQWLPQVKKSIIIFGWLVVMQWLHKCHRCLLAGAYGIHHDKEGEG